jgi:hypothetical protein
MANNSLILLRHHLDQDTRKGFPLLALLGWISARFLPPLPAKDPWEAENRGGRGSKPLVYPRLSVLVRVPVNLISYAQPLKTNHQKQITKDQPQTTSGSLGMSVAISEADQI